MRSLTRFTSIAMAAAGAILAAVGVARAETCSLELKRLESQGRAGVFVAGTDYMYRATQSQHFFVQMQREGEGRIVPRGHEQQTDTFKKIVKKEPEYALEQPFRGVAKLGTQEYAFALDFVAPDSEKEDKESKPTGDKPKDEAAKADAKEAKSASPLAKLQAEILKATGAEVTVAKPVAYNRLYFDFNHNGDLTDDRVVEAESQHGALAVGVGQSYARIQFPRVDVAIDVDGTKIQYSFFLTGHANASRDFSYASIQINAAAYREGEMTLEGKKRHIVLIDFNSNGRFDDETKIAKEMRGANGQLYPQQGDMLLVDPDPKSLGISSPYDVTSGTSRHYVSKVVNIDNRFYDLKVLPAGDQLTLTPSTVPLGSVTNPNESFRAVIYGDLGFLKITGKKDVPIAVPQGEWKLLSYTIDLTGIEEPSKPAEEKKPEKKEESKEGSLLQALAKTAERLLGGGPQPGGRYRHTIVAAGATADYKAIKVGKDETVEMPFGPPYKPSVTAYPRGGAPQMQLQMSLVGSAGEICTNMMVDGNRPQKAKFTITDPEGKTVQQGNFEYG